MGIQVVRIDVDVHEPARISAELVRLGANVSISTLPVGDYRIGSTLVERKTARDLHRTLSAGRLWGQLGRLRASSSAAILLVEGERLDEGSISAAAIRGALLTAAENGVTVVRSENKVDSALWLHRIAARSTKRRAPDRPTYAQPPKSANPEAVPAAIPGISSASARALLTHFGNLNAVVSATDADLRDVIGIGETRAARIAQTFSHPHAAYRSRQSRERPDPAT